MRILLLTGFSHPFSDALYQRLAQEPDFEIFQVTPSIPNHDPSPKSSTSCLNELGLLPATLRSLGATDDPHRVYLKPLHLYLRQAQPDLVVCQFEQESIAAAQTAISCSLLRPAVPLTLYSWQNILRRRSPAVRFVDFITLRRATHITCASSEAVAVLRRKGFRGSTNIAPLIGVDTQVFYRRPDEEVQAMRARHNIEGFAVGYAGRLVHDKSIDTLIDAFAKLDLPSTLVIIGSGEELNTLKRQAHQLGIMNRCRFIGHVEHGAMSAHLSMIDTFVLPSRTTDQWKEQFGRVLIEAMACNVPVIGSDSGAIPEVIGDAGLIFHEGDAQALTTAIERLARQPELRQVCAQRGYQRVMSSWTLEAIANQTAQVWRRLVAHQDKPGIR